MQKIKYKVIGLMSGTSLDGLDLAYCCFENVAGKWAFELVKSKSIPYTDKLLKSLSEANNLSAVSLLKLDVSYGGWLGRMTKDFITENDLKVDFIASHGHTVHHLPDEGITCQIGAGQLLANETGLKVIADFRSKDVSLGGQGAPLVPVGDQLLFSEYDFCLNLGGIANISYQVKDQRIAYDIGIANMVLNWLVKSLGKSYDPEGEIAKSGKVCQNLLDELNSLPYYHKGYPKSTGFEWFEQEIKPLFLSDESGVADQLCTAVHHIAFQIASAVNGLPGVSSLLISGGGAKNTFLIDCLRDYLDSGNKVIIPDTSIIDFKEAIVFGFMGVLRDRHEVNCLKSVTGATNNSSGGVVYFPG